MEYVDLVDLTSDTSETSDIEDLPPAALFRLCALKVEALRPHINSIHYAVGKRGVSHDTGALICKMNHMECN